MVINLNPTLPIPAIDLPGQRPTAAKPAGPSDFTSVFEDAVLRVESYQKQAADSVDKFLTGESGDIHAMALAGQRADLTFDLFLQTRNKIVQAYQEVMRMQL